VLKSFDFSTGLSTNPGFLGFLFTFSGDESALAAFAGASGLLSLEHDRQVIGAKVSSARRATSIEELAAARNASAAFRDRSLASQKIDTESDVAWPLDRIDQPDWPLDGQYTYEETGKGVRLYVVGGGIQLNHDEFKRRNGGTRAVKGYDFMTPFGSADEAIECDPVAYPYGFGFTTLVRSNFMHLIHLGDVFWRAFNLNTLLGSFGLSCAYVLACTV
jgi:hypothetical protein